MHKRVLFFLAMLFLGLFFLKLDVNTQAASTQASLSPSLVVDAQADVAVSANPSPAGGGHVPDVRVPASPSMERVEPISVMSVTFPEDYSNDEAYCRALVAGIDIPLLGDARVAVGMRSDTNGKVNRTVKIQAAGCAEGTFSEVEFNLDHQVVGYSDCRQTTPEALALAHGMSYGQGFESPNRGNEVHLKTLNGFFVKDCGGVIEYTRDGNFVKNPTGTLEDRGGCVILDRNMQKITYSGKLDDLGCLSSGQCLAQVDLTASSFKIVNGNKALATGNPVDILVPAEDNFIRQGHLADALELEGVFGQNPQTWDRVKGRNCGDVLTAAE